MNVYKNLKLEILCRQNYIIGFLPQANEFPPNSSESKPDYNVNNTNEESITPPFSKGNIVGTEKHRS